MRLQCGPLHVGWRGRERLVYVRATFRRGRRCACNSQHNTTAKERHGVITLLYHPTFSCELEVSRSIEVSGCLMFSHEVRCFEYSQKHYSNFE